MKTGLILLSAGLIACGGNKQPQAPAQTPASLAGTWQLIAGTTIEKGDTTVTDYTKNRSFIKVINATHFAFLKHDLVKGKGTTADFGAGGGRYELRDSVYTEHLDYCNDREWEGTEFTFIVTLQHDTLTQRGIEKVAKAGIDRINIEQYRRLPD